MESITERDYLEDLGVDKIIVLKWFLETQTASCSGQRSVVSCCEHGNELSGSIKEKESLNELNDCWFAIPDIDYFHEVRSFLRSHQMLSY
jgi:hypothetical protein